MTLELELTRAKASGWKDSRNQEKPGTAVFAQCHAEFLRYETKAATLSELLRRRRLPQPRIERERKERA